MLAPNPKKRTPQDPGEYPTLIVFGCSRTDCDCEVHDRRLDAKHQLEPTEGIRVYHDMDRFRAKDAYKRLFPLSRKIITLFVEDGRRDKKAVATAA